MVFEPTFDEIGREADSLPDLSGGGPEIDGDEDAAGEGDALGDAFASDRPADDLPPLGA